ncbi:MAG: type IV pilus biogenesis/stability protein PilW [Gammaproteobacteria bacterium]|nr:type IV pilus biogenesis/stability protein PilW [Gammaproteobacteria bacterium]
MLNSFKTLGAMTFCLFMLSACVTETTNPVFNAETSDSDALQDYLLLAIGYLDEGDLTSAKRHLQNAAGIDADNSVMFGIWGLINAREGEAVLAETNFRRSLREDSSNSQSRNNYAAFLFSQNRIDDAYEQLEIVVGDTEYDQRSQAFENMGIAALTLSRMDDAESAFRRAMQLNPNQLRSALELAAININNNNFQQARIYWQNYLTLTQFYNLAHNARSLLIGARLEQAQENAVNVRQYGELLRTNFPDSQEYQVYRQLID